MIIMVVAKYLLEFKALWDLGKDDIRIVDKTGMLSEM